MNFVLIGDQFNASIFCAKGQSSLQRSRNQYLSFVGILQYVIKFYIVFAHMFNARKIPFAVYYIKIKRLD